MKKIICITMLICLLLTHVSCTDRRNEIRDNQTTNSEKLNIGDDVLSFYEGMSEEDYVELYNSVQVTDKTSGSILNTPYYYIFTDGNVKGGQAFNKLTNSFENLCKDPFCDHTSCIFSEGMNYFTEEFIVYGDRIYVLVSAIPNSDSSKQYYLYSMDLLLQDLTLVYKFPITVEDQYVDGEATFIHGIQDLFFYDSAVYCYDFYVDADDMISPTIYKLDLNTKKYGIFLEGTYVQNGSLRLHNQMLSWKNLDEEWVYYDLNSNSYVAGTFEKMKYPEEYKVNAQILWGDYGYVTIDHTTEQFASDPFYEYYKADYSDNLLQLVGSRDVPLRRGGEIYRVEINEDGEVMLEPCVKMETDGIPDLIYDFCIDGKTVLVKYETYKDFENLYNSKNEGSDTSEFHGFPGFSGGTTIAPYSYKYALIDLETGMIIRDIKPIAS